MSASPEIVSYLDADQLILASLSEERAGSCVAPLSSELQFDGCATTSPGSWAREYPRPRLTLTNPYLRYQQGRLLSICVLIPCTTTAIAEQLDLSDRLVRIQQWIRAIRRWPDIHNWPAKLWIHKCTQPRSCIMLSGTSHCDNYLCVSHAHIMIQWGGRQKEVVFPNQPVI